MIKKDILTEILFLRSYFCKFIRISISNAKNGYDLDYEVGNIEAFIDEFKNKKKLKDKIKEKEKSNKKNKRTRSQTKRTRRQK